MITKNVFYLFLLISNIAFAGENSWWLDYSANCKPDKSGFGYAPFYNKEGHGNTTYVVAKIAGHKDFKATQFACYSQMPDAEVMRLSAPTVAIWGIFAPEYRHLIMADLHSLYGGEGDEVKVRRDKLAKLVEQGKDSMQVWQVGFIIHAMGDSYAHVSDNGESIKAYGEFIGHALAFSEKPDEIAYEDNFTHYKLFVERLYEALKTDQASSENLNRFISEVENAVNTGDEGNVKKAIINFKLNETDEDIKFEQETISNVAQYNFSSKDEKNFLRWLRDALEAPQ